MPAPSRPISREYRIYLAIWRKAWLSPEGAPTVSIKCPNLHMAVAMRQGMYRAIKPFRLGEMSDDELAKAAEKYVLYLVKADSASQPHFIELRERKALSILELQLAELGIDGEDDLQVGDERTVKANLDKLIEKPSEAPRKTAFYEREQ